MTDFDITGQIPFMADSGARSGWNCPEQAELVAYTEAKLGDAERTRLEAHLADCGFCLGQVGFLVREAGGEAPAVPARLLNAARGVRVRWIDKVPKPALTALASAAALILAVAVVVQTNLVSGPADVSRPASDPALESTTGPPFQSLVRNGITGAAAPRILHPKEGESITESRAEVFWETYPGVLEYTVLLVNLEGDVLWEERSSGLSAVISPTAELEPGQKYFVWVEAHLQIGGSVKSAAVGFRVAVSE